MIIENLREKVILSDNAFASSISVPKIYLSDEVGVLQSLCTVMILFWRTLMSKNLWRKCLHHRISARVKWTKYGCTLLTLHLLLFISRKYAFICVKRQPIAQIKIHSLARKSKYLRINQIQ